MEIYSYTKLNDQNIFILFFTFKCLTVNLFNERDSLSQCGVCARVYVSKFMYYVDI